MDNEFKKGFIVTYFNMFIGMFVTLFLTPFVIRALGQKEYGLYSLIGSTVGYFHLLEFGLGNTITRYSAKFQTEHRIFELKKLIGIIIRIYGIINILMLILCLIVFVFLKDIFISSIENDEQLQTLQYTLIILGVTSSFGIFGTAFSALLTGLGKLSVPRVASSFSWFFRIVLTIVVIFRFSNAIALTVATSFGIIVTSMVNIFYFFFKMRLYPAFGKFDFYLLKELLIFSFYNFTQEIMGNFYWKIGTIFAGIFLANTLVAVYSIGIQLSMFVLQFTNSFVSMLLPKATRMAVKNSTVKETTHFISVIARFILFLYGGITLAFLFFGKEFIILWAGHEYEMAYWVVLISLLGPFLPRIQSGANIVLRAKNLHGFLSFCYAITGVLNVLLSYFFLKKFGIIGLCFATAISLFLANWCLANWYYHTKCGIDIRQFFSETFSKKIIPFCITFLSCFLFKRINLPNAWICFFIHCALYCIVYVFSTLFWGLNSDEKQFILNHIGRIRG